MDQNLFKEIDQTSYVNEETLEFQICDNKFEYYSSMSFQLPYNPGITKPVVGACSGTHTVSTSNCGF